MVVLFLSLASITTIRMVVGPDRVGALAWGPLFLFTGVGLGILLVRDTPELDDGNDAGSVLPPPRHRKTD
jgi:hypothetical protein